MWAYYISLCVTDYELFLLSVANLEELRKQEGQEQENYRVQIEELKERCGEKQERVEGERQRFIDFKKQVAVNSLNSRSGKSIPPKVQYCWIDRFIWVVFYVHTSEYFSWLQASIYLVGNWLLTDLST